MGQVQALLQRSSASLASGATLRAVDQAQEAFCLAQGRDADELRALEALGAAMWSRGELRHAALVLGAAARLRERTGLEGASDLDELASLSPGWAEGRELVPSDVLAWLREGRDRRGHPTSGWESLTASELQVVELAAEGLTNPRIAQKLFLSTNTVKTHLQRAYRKLGVSSRAQLSRERR